VVAVEYKITEDTLTPAIGRLLHSVENFTPALEKAGDVLVGSLQRTFHAGGRPDKWKPLSPATLVLSEAQAEARIGGEGLKSKPRVRRTGRSLPLRDTGKLLASMSPGGTGHVHEISPRRLFVGSNLMVGKYNLAEIHHFGAEPRVTRKSRFYLGARGLWLKKTTDRLKIPARPIFVELDEDRKRITRIFEWYILAAWKAERVGS